MAVGGHWGIERPVHRRHHSHCCTMALADAASASGLAWRAAVAALMASVALARTSHSVPAKANGSLGASDGLGTRMGDSLASEDAQDEDDDRGAARVQHS